jgi:hypothetical protein
MVLRLYDTGGKQEREFVPHRAGTASTYVCGATVQGPHTSDTCVAPSSTTFFAAG